MSILKNTMVVRIGGRISQCDWVRGIIEAIWHGQLFWVSCHVLNNFLAPMSSHILAFSCVPVSQVDAGTSTDRSIPLIDFGSFSEVVRPCSASVKGECPAYPVNNIQTSQVISSVIHEAHIRPDARTIQKRRLKISRLKPMRLKE